MVDLLPPLNALRFFEAAARHLSFTVAAEELHLTQSAVSYQVKQLEAALGILLFERLPHGLVLTSAGDLYLMEVRPVLQRLRFAGDRLGRQARGRDVLAVSMLPAFAAKCLLPRLARFANAFPGIDLSLTAATELVDPDAAGLDCCLRYGPGGWAGVAAERLGGEDLVAVASPTLLAQGLPIATPADLRHHRLIHDKGPVTWIEWLAHAGAPEPDGTGHFFTESTLAYQAAIDGGGVALGRSLLVADDLRAGRLASPLAASMPAPFAYFLIRPIRRRSPLADAFRDWLMAELFTPEAAG
jgi:LysR family glycine cleavage system transcriptional activator